MKRIKHPRKSPAGIYAQWSLRRAGFWHILALDHVWHCYRIYPLRKSDDKLLSRVPSENLGNNGAGRQDETLGTQEGIAAAAAATVAVFVDRQRRQFTLTGGTDVGVQPCSTSTTVLSATGDFDDFLFTWSMSSLYTILHKSYDNF